MHDDKFGVGFLNLKFLCLETILLSFMFKYHVVLQSHTFISILYSVNLQTTYDSQ